MSESNGKHRKIYEDHRKGESKTCLIHGHVNSLDEFTGLGDFRSKYVKIIHSKDSGHDSILRK